MAELTSVAALKRWLNVSGSTHDTILGECLDRAEARIRGICNRENGWLAANWDQETEKFDGEDFDRLILTYNPIDTGDTFAVTVDGVALASTDYTLDAPEGVLALTDTAWSLRPTYPSPSAAVLPALLRGPSRSFGHGFRNVAITYTGGYPDSDSIPKTLQDAAIQGAAYLFRDRSIHPRLASHQLGAHAFALSDAEWAAFDGVVRPMLRLGGLIRRPIA